MANDQALDTLQIDIQASGVSAADGIQKLADAIRHLRTAVGKDGSKLDNLSKALTAVNTAVGRTNYGKIMSVAASLSRLANSLNMVHGASAQSFQNVIKRIEKLEGTVTKSAESVEKMKESLNGGWGGQGQSNPITETLDGITESAKEAQKEVAAVAEQAQIGPFKMGPVHEPPEADQEMRSSVSGTQSSINKVISQIRKSLRSVLQYAKKIGVAVGKALIAPLRLVGKAIGELAGKFRDLAIKGITLPFRAISGMANKITNFIRAIGRIALYRAIRSAIKAVTQGLQEGIQNLYQWSLLMDHTFANSMDSIATSMQYLHNGFAAMFSPLIEYAAPILEEITNKVVDFFNIIQQIFATLTGQTTWHKAIRVQKQYGDQIAETGQAAEKAMHQLMAFDELNVINSPSAGGSGGSGQQTPDYGSMFTTEEVDTELTSWVQDIMDFFNSGEFYNLGKYVAEKLNVLVDQWNAYGDGFKFGEKIRHALETFNGFLENFEFADLGAKVAEWFIGLWDGVNPATVIQFFRNVLTAIRDFVSGFIGRIIKEWEDRTGLSFDQFGSWLAGELNKRVQNWNSYLDGFNLGERIRAVLHQINVFLKTFNFYDLGAKVGDWIAGLIDGITVDELADGVAGAINAALGLGSGLLGKLQERGVPRKIGEAIGKAAARINWDDLVSILNSIAAGIVDMIVGAFKAFDKEDGFGKVSEALKGLNWQSKLLLALPLGIEIVKITTTLTLAMLKMALLSAILNGGAVSLAGIASGVALGAVSLVAGALVIGVTLRAVWKWANGDMDPGPGHDDDENPVVNLTNEANHRQKEADQKHAEDVIHQMLTAGVFGQLKQQADSVDPLGLMDKWLKMGDIASGSPEFKKWLKEQGPFMKKTLSGVEDIATDVGDQTETIKDTGSKISGGGFTLPGIGGNPFADEVTVPFKLDLKKVLGDELNQAGGILDASAFPAKVGALGTKAADMLKNGVKNANIPKVFDDEATVSATKFGTHDFSPGGLHAGEGIKTGVDRADLSGKMASVREGMLSKLREGDFEGNGKNIMDRTGNGIDSVNLPQKIANTAASMLNSLRWAGWESVGAQIGDAAGANFKPHFKQHLQTSITLYGSGGTPLTTVYAVPYAQGGFPSQGSLFLAGEMAGQAEMIGSINGRTGVASGREITGISDAVYSTGAEEATLLRQTNLLLHALLVKDPFGTPNSNAGRWISQSQQAYKAVTG